MLPNRCVNKLNSPRGFSIEQGAEREGCPFLVHLESAIVESLAIITPAELLSTLR